ncbi:MAG: Short-chain dehydrogenase/reductase SDR, partial [uncultured Rubrobacteraceae bacterium]
EHLEGGPDHGLLDRDRPRDRRASGGQRLESLRLRPRCREDRVPRGPRVRVAPARRHGRNLHAGCRGRGRASRGGRRRPGQQRGLQPVRRRRGGPDGEGAPAVRDQRVRARQDVPVGAPGDAAAGLGQNRQHLLHGRQAHLPRRRLLPRDEVRRRVHKRRPPLRSRRLRRQGRGSRTGSHPHGLRRRRDRLDDRDVRPRGRPLRRFQRGRGKDREGQLRAGPVPQARRWPRDGGDDDRTRHIRGTSPRPLRRDALGPPLYLAPSPPSRPRLGRLRRYRLPPTREV